MEPCKEKAGPPIIHRDKCKVKTAPGRKQGLLVSSALCELNWSEESSCVYDCVQIQYTQFLACLCRHAENNLIVFEFKAKWRSKDVICLNLCQ